MIPRLGERVVPGRTYTHRPGVYLLACRGTDVLMTIQTEPEAEFQLPGGGVDPGEQPLHALHREVMEETGWRIAAPRRIASFRRFVFMPDYDMWAEKLCHVFAAHPVRQIIDPTEPHHLAVWMPRDLAARHAVDPGHVAVLKGAMP